MGAMPSIIPKLYQLLKEEYNLQAGVKERISSLTQELELAQAALCKVAEVPWDQLDKQVQIWARKVREASYDMEDVLDTFLVRVQGPESTEENKSLQKHLKKMTNFFKKSKARRKISGDVKNIMTHLNEMTEQCHRYKVEDIGTRTAMTSTVDPRLHAMYTQVNKLVGVDKSSGELMSMLQTNMQQGDESSEKMKIVSIVGVGGLGKTTLAKVVYEKMKGDFDCTAFVPVGRNPDLKKILKDILMDLDKQRYLKYSTAALDERQLIDEFRKFFLENKKSGKRAEVLSEKSVMMNCSCSLPLMTWTPAGHHSNPANPLFLMKRRNKVPFLMKVMAKAQQHLDSCQDSKCLNSKSVSRPSGTLVTATSPSQHSSLRSRKSASKSRGGLDPLPLKWRKRRRH